jgi:hypothetical protein
MDADPTNPDSTSRIMSSVYMAVTISCAPGVFTLPNPLTSLTPLTIVAVAILETLTLSQYPRTHDDTNETKDYK